MTHCGNNTVTCNNYAYAFFTLGDIIGIVFGLFTAFGTIIAVVPFVICCCRGKTQELLILAVDTHV